MFYIFKAFFTNSNGTLINFELDRFYKEIDLKLIYFLMFVFDKSKFLYIKRFKYTLYV